MRKAKGIGKAMPASGMPMVPRAIALPPRCTNHLDTVESAVMSQGHGS